MKVSFYLLIFIVILGCLAISFKYKYNYKLQISEKFADIPDVPVISSVKYENNSILLNWTRPNSIDPIINYFIFIKKADENTEGVYLHVVSEPNCTSCTYTINNLNLIHNSDYYVSVMAININGASPASEPFNFKTLVETPTQTPTQTPTDTPTITPTQTPFQSTPVPTLTLEDTIRMMQNEKKTYLDSELKNMIIRADGIYEVNKTELAYPDKYLDDVKQSINTINDVVKKDLQEYRLNIHLSSPKNN
jgi:hypothetical protein